VSAYGDATGVDARTDTGTAVNASSNSGSAVVAGHSAFTGAVATVSASTNSHDANGAAVKGFVESPMMDIYNGNTTTDSNGYATVSLPDYFQALNEDFRYQLTVVGRSFAHAIAWTPIHDNQFTIRTDHPQVQVSWQVTGIRHDPYANSHRIQVIVPKAGPEQGHYIDPQGYGQPANKSVFAAQMHGHVGQHTNTYLHP
jgi:hypothetical protein